MVDVLCSQPMIFGPFGAAVAEYERMDLNILEVFCKIMYL